MIRMLRTTCHSPRALALAGSVALAGGGAWAGPALAQVAVFDAGNYSRNVLTAAHTLQQVNNQIRSLQNEATMLLNQARNLARIDFPEMTALTQSIRQVDQLMRQADGIRLQVSGLDREFRALFPLRFEQALRLDQQVVAARTRLETATAGYQHALTVQAQIAGDIAADADTLAALVARSQAATGALQVGQATNQLLALTAKQQFQLQGMLIAQGRADAIEQARRASEEAGARAARRRFLGSGTAYTRQ